MFHSLITSQYKKQLEKSNDLSLHVGWYSFEYAGGSVRGNVRRIGDNTLTVDIQFCGVRELPVLEFLAANPCRI